MHTISMSFLSLPLFLPRCIIQYRTKFSSTPCPCLTRTLTRIGVAIVSEFISSARVMRGALIVNPWKVEEVSH